MTSWDLKIGKFPSGVNKSEPIGEKQIPRIIDKVSGYRMLDADPIYGKSLGVMSQSRKVFYSKCDVFAKDMWKPSLKPRMSLLVHRLSITWPRCVYFQF